MDSQRKCKPVKLYYQLHEPMFHNPKLSPIIFLHGVLASHSTWKGVCTKIGDKTNRKVYTVDLRNHGKSEYSEHNSQYDHKADLENFLSENKIQKCILMGHSLGGRIAMFFAMQKPEQVEKLITEDTDISEPSLDMDEMKTMVAAARKIHMLPKGMNEAEIRDILAHLVTEKYPSQQKFAHCAPLRKNRDGSYRFDFNFDVLEKSYKDKSAYRIDFNECQKFTGPVLVMYGEEFKMKVETDEKIKEFFPNAELCPVKTSIHILHADKPDDVVKYATNFIKK